MNSTTLKHATTVSTPHHETNAGANCDKLHAVLRLVLVSSSSWHPRGGGCSGQATCPRRGGCGS